MTNLTYLIPVMKEFLIPFLSKKISLIQNNKNIIIITSKKLSRKIPICNKIILSKASENIDKQLKEISLIPKLENIIYLDLKNPSITKKDINISIEIYKKSKLKALFSINPFGFDNHAIKIIDLKEWKKQKNYIKLVKKQGLILNMSLDKSLILNKKSDLKKKKPKKEKYTTKNQLNLAKKYPDTIVKMLAKKKSKYTEKISRNNPERLKTLLKIPHGKYCLDVGCSGGAISIELAKHGRIVMAIDILPSAIKTANKLREKLPEKIKKRIRFYISSAEEFKTKNNFDTIYITEVLEHMPYDQGNKVIETYIKKMKKNGNMIISVPNRFPGKYYTSKKQSRWYFIGHRSHYNLVTLKFRLKKYFKNITFYTIRKNETPQECVFLIANCTSKKY